MPVRFFEGVRGEMAEVNRRNMQRRFSVLAAAVREHEMRTRRGGVDGDHDRQLYAKLRALTADSHAPDQRRAPERLGRV